MTKNRNIGIFADCKCLGSDGWDGCNEGCAARRGVSLVAVVPTVWNYGKGDKMKTMIKRHNDAWTVIEEIRKMEHEYLSQGYDVFVMGNLLKLKLDDGFVLIYWQDGAFWQEIIADVDVQ